MRVTDIEERTQLLG